MYKKKNKNIDLDIQMLEKIISINQLPKQYRNKDTIKQLNLAFRFAKTCGITYCENCKYDNKCPKQNDILCFSDTLDRLLESSEKLDEKTVSQLDKQYTFNSNYFEFTDKLFTVAVLFYTIISVFLDLMLGTDYGYWVIMIIIFVSTIVMHISFNDKKKEYTSLGKTFINGLEAYGNSLGLIGAIVALLLEYLKISRDNTLMQKWGVLYFIVTAVVFVTFIVVVPLGRYRNTKNSQRILSKVLKSMDIKRNHNKKRNRVSAKK